MERTSLPKLVRDIPSLECMHIRAAYVSTERKKFPEQNCDVTRFDPDQSVRSIGISQCPSAFTNQPIDEGSDRIRQLQLNSGFCDRARSVRFRHRQCDHTGLLTACAATF